MTRGKELKLENTDNLSFKGALIFGPPATLSFLYQKMMKPIEGICRAYQNYHSRKYDVVSRKQFQ